MNILPQDRQVAVISALIEGCSIRATERMTETHRDTVMRLGARIGRGCAALHDMMFRDLNINQLQFDELWAYIGKKQKRVKRDDDPTKGDCYTFLALDPLDKAIISYRVGKRTGETTLDFVRDVRARVLGMPFITSDAFPAYEPAIRAVFGPGVHYTQIVKTYVNEPPVNAARRYSPGAIVKVAKERVFGAMPEFMASTSHVERVNLSVRMGSRRFTRLTNGYSKKVENHEAAVALFVAHYNLCRVHESLKMTPAMALGLTDRLWSVAELIDVAVAMTESAVRPN
ncbi:transposase [Mesorhizobium sp. KR9-304]|uniref:transposase n=1 Tax=Mesorhizobium sp. KR9-304 TaxID=3156614 RepID=UPI0032B3C5F4